MKKYIISLKIKEKKEYFMHYWKPLIDREFVITNPNTDLAKKMNYEEMIENMKKIKTIVNLNKFIVKEEEIEKPKKFSRFQIMEI